MHLIPGQVLCFQHFIPGQGHKFFSGRHIPVLFLQGRPPGGPVLHETYAFEFVSRFMVVDFVVETVYGSRFCQRFIGMLE